MSRTTPDYSVGDSVEIPDKNNKGIINDLFFNGMAGWVYEIKYKNSLHYYTEEDLDFD